MAKKGKEKRKSTDKRKDYEEFERVKRSQVRDPAHMLQGRQVNDRSMLERLTPFARKQLGYEAFPQWSRVAPSESSVRS